MSGFLHQLASRSLGLAPQIKSRAALPYAAPTADFPTTETIGLEPPPTAPAIERQAHEAPAQNARSSDHAAENSLPAPVVAQKTERAASVARQAPHPAADASQPPRVSRPLSPEDTPLEIARGSQPPPRTVDAIASPATAQLKPVQRHPEPAPESRHAGDETQARFANLETLVTRLLGDEKSQTGTSPETAPPPATTMPRASNQPPQATSTIRALAGRERPAITPEIDSAPEVHITIGRLEVNPPSRPAPAAQPPRPRGLAPLSLSDYLARRNGGGS
jgi:hypothetical protein